MAINKRNIMIMSL